MHYVYLHIFKSFDIENVSQTNLDGLAQVDDNLITHRAFSATPRHAGVMTTREYIEYIVSAGHLLQPHIPITVFYSDLCYHIPRKYIREKQLIKKLWYALRGRKAGSVIAPEIKRVGCEYIQYIHIKSFDVCMLCTHWSMKTKMNENMYSMNIFFFKH